MILCVPGWDFARIPLLLAATSHNFTLYLVNLSWFPGFQINYSCVPGFQIKAESRATWLRVASRRAESPCRATSCDSSKRSRAGRTGH